MCSWCIWWREIVLTLIKFLPLYFSFCIIIPTNWVAQHGSKRDYDYAHGMWWVSVEPFAACARHLLKAAVPDLPCATGQGGACAVSVPPPCHSGSCRCAVAACVWVGQLVTTAAQAHSRAPA